MERGKKEKPNCLQRKKIFKKKVWLLSLFFCPRSQILSWPKTGKGEEGKWLQIAGPKKNPLFPSFSALELVPGCRETSTMEEEGEEGEEEEEEEEEEEHHVSPFPPPPPPPPHPDTVFRVLGHRRLLLPLHSFFCREHRGQISSLACCSGLCNSFFRTNLIILHPPCIRYLMVRKV